MKRARKVSNVHPEVYFKEKQRLTITFTENKLPRRKPSRKGAEDSIVGKVSCHQHATLPKLNSPTALPTLINNNKVNN